METCGHPTTAGLSEVADAELLRLVKAGSQPAFSALYDRHANAAYSVALGVVLDRALAEDVVQTSFLGLWRSPSSYDPTRGTVRPWLLTIVRNRAIDVLRQGHARARREAAAESQGWLDRSALVALDEQVAADEQGRLLRALVAALPGKQREAIELAFFAELTHGEISERLSVPLGTVKSRVRLGIGRLRGSFG